MTRNDFIRIMDSSRFRFYRSVVDIGFISVRVADKSFDSKQVSALEVAREAGCIISFRIYSAPVRFLFRLGIIKNKVIVDRFLLPRQKGWGR